MSTVSGQNGEAAFNSPSRSQAQQRSLKPAAASRSFQLWQPGFVDAHVRPYLLGEGFQSAVQLTVGLSFVSLFVYVE